VSDDAPRQPAPAAGILRARDLEARLRHAAELQGAVLKTPGSRFGTLGAVAKRFVSRMIRFQTLRQVEFNRAALEALRQAEQELGSMARRVEDLTRELHRTREQVSTDLRTEVDALRPAVDSLPALLGELRAELTKSSSEAAETVERTVHAQGRHLDEVAGHMAALAKDVRRAQLDLLDIGGQLPALATELRDRISALERCLRPDVALDHFDFARRFRGDEEEIKERMHEYARLFGPVHNVLDLGCGRGEFLEVCAELGVGALGVDSNPDMVIRCQMKNLKVVHADVLGYLRDLEDRSLDGIFSAQVVEHLTTAELTDLVDLAAAKLRRGGIFVAETIDPSTFSALRWYYLDITHRQPIPSETLQFLLEGAGFDVRDVMHLSPVAEDEKLAPLLPLADSGGDPQLQKLLEGYDANIDRLNAILYGPQDYAIIAER
jgi:O-antigen chain-terminating methyltransferase